MILNEFCQQSKNIDFFVNQTQFFKNEKNYLT